MATPPPPHSPSSSVLRDDRAEAVLNRLHAEAGRQEPKLIWANIGQLPSLALGRGIRFKDENARFYDDKYISIGPTQGRLLYMLARAKGVRNIIEFGTSHAISTIYLALAVRDNGGGKVVSSELVASKIERAAAHLDEAGCAEYVDIREGDARETLAALEDAQYDMALLDGFPTVALDVLKVIEPKLKPGALVLADDINLFKADLQPLVDYLEAPENGYRVLALRDFDDGFLMALRG